MQSVLIGAIAVACACMGGVFFVIAMMLMDCIARTPAGHVRTVSGILAAASFTYALTVMRSA